MKPNLFATFALAAVSALAAGCGNTPSSAEAATKDGGLMSRILLRSAPIMVPAGTPVTVRLQHSISSASAASGSNFDFTLVEPLVVNGRTVAASGSRGVGRVVASRKSGRLHNSGYLRIAMASIEFEGAQVPVQSSSIFVSGGKHAKRNTTFIGGSAAAGALIGGLAGGGKGALIGAGIGAGAGTGAAYASGKKEVGFAAERVLTFKITQPLTLEL
jgi:hypothetical protein